MAKIQFEEELRNELHAGAKQLGDVVLHNFGPNGRNTIMDQKYDLPMIANSGRKVLTDFSLENPFQSVGAELIRDAALKIGKTYGDGTIACTILANALLESGYKMIAAGYNPMLMRKGAMAALQMALQSLQDICIPSDALLIRQAAAHVAKDEKLGELVIQACEAVGSEGIITVLDSQGRETELHAWDGTRYEYGLHGREFAEQESTKSVELQNLRVMLINQRIRDIAQVAKVVVQASQTHTPLLMIVSDIDDPVLSILAANVAQKRVRLAVAKAPGHGDTRRRNMFALSAKTGAAVFEDNGVRKIEDCGLESCGYVDYARIDMEATLLRGFPAESPEMVQMLLDLVNRQLRETTADYEVETLQGTVSILCGKNAEIVAGGITEYEMFERKYLLENTVNAVRNIARYGVVPGGGKSWLYASKMLGQQIGDMDGEEKVGAQCLQKALLKPLQQMADNSGVDGSPVIQKLLECPDVWTGFDANTGTIGSLREKGIVDSAKAAQEILRTAVETATSLWTTAAAVV